MVKRYMVSLTLEEQEYLQSIIGKRNEKAAIVKRAYALLAADCNGAKQWTDRHISDCYGQRVRTIEKIRQRFVADGLETVLKGKERTGFKEKQFDGKTEARLVSLRCSDPPQGKARRTLALLQEEMIALGYVETISDETIRQMLKKTSSSPGRRNAG